MSTTHTPKMSVKRPLSDSWGFYGVYDLISRGAINKKSRVKQSCKSYRLHCARHHMTRLQINKKDNHIATFRVWQQMFTIINICSDYWYLDIFMS